MPQREPGSEDAAKAEAKQPVVVLDAGLANVLFDVWVVSRATTTVVEDAVRSSGLDAGELFQPALREVNRRMGREVADTHRRLRTLHQVVTTVADDLD